MEPVVRYFEEQIGLGSIVLVIIIGVVSWCVWKLAVIYTKKTTQVENLPCDKHEKVIDKLAKEINGINVSLGKLETGLENTNRMIGVIAGSSPISPLTQSHSPISLTQMGKNIADALGLEKALDNNWRKINSIIKDERNPYDIQTEFILSFIKALDKYLDAETVDKIKEDAFMRGLPLIDYMRMLGVMARDRYFSEHGIDIIDVDKNDPGKNI